MQSDKFRLALQWRDDVAGGEMIQSKNYTRQHLAFDSFVFQSELDAICAGANAYYKMMGVSHRIYNYMGELRPYNG